VFRKGKNSRAKTWTKKGFLNLKGKKDSHSGKRKRKKKPQFAKKNWRTACILRLALFYIREGVAAEDELY